MSGFQDIITGPGSLDVLMHLNLFNYIYFASELYLFQPIIPLKCATNYHDIVMPYCPPPKIVVDMKTKEASSKSRYVIKALPCAYALHV